MRCEMLRSSSRQIPALAAAVVATSDVWFV